MPWQHDTREATHIVRAALLDFQWEDLLHPSDFALVDFHPFCPFDTDQELKI